MRAIYQLFYERAKKIVQQQDGAAAVKAPRLASLEYDGCRAAHPKRCRRAARDGNGGAKLSLDQFLAAVPKIKYE